MSCEITRYRNLKLPAGDVNDQLFTPSRVIVSDATGMAVASSIKASELNQLSGVRSNIQAQIDALASVSITSGDLTETGSSILTITGGGGAVIGSGTTIQVKQASASQGGFLSSADWSNFNSKLSSALPQGNVLIGNALGFASPVSLSGDVSLSSDGSVLISDGAVTNAKVANNAAISFQKMASLTPSKVAVTGPSGKITVSTLDSSKLTYLADVTSPIQAQLDAKISATLTSPDEGDILYRNSLGQWVNLPLGTNDQVLSSDGTSVLWRDENTSTLPSGGSAGQILAKNSGVDYDAGWRDLILTDISDVAVSVTELSILNGALISTEELNWLQGATSNIQVQIDNKQEKLTGSIVSLVGVTLNANRAVVTGSTGNLITSPTTANEIAFLQNLTSNVQNQLDSKITYSGTAPSAGDILYYNSGWVNLPVGSDGQVLKLASGLPSWGTDLTGGGSSLPNGGTTGQFLVKQSGVDGDADWETLLWSAITDTTASLTEINYVTGVTSSIQAQLDGKQATITGGATTITSTNLTASRALVSNASGKVAVSTVTSTELGHLSGVTSAVQTQLNSKITYAGTAPSTGDILVYNSGWVNVGIGTDNQVLSSLGGLPVWQSVSTGTNPFPSGGVINSLLRKTNTDTVNHTTEWFTMSLGFNSDVSITTPATGDLLYYSGAGWVNIARGSSGQVLSSSGSTIQWANNTLEGLSDTTITTPAPGATMYYDGSVWRNKPVGSTGQYFKVTASGQVNWANIALSDITGVNASVTEVNYLVGVTGGVQGQLNGKQAVITGAASTVTTTNLTASRALISDGSGKISISPTTSSELNFLSGVTSFVQTQLNSKITYGGTAPVNGDILYYESGWKNLPIGTNGQVLKVSPTGFPFWGTDITGGGGSLPAGGGTGQYLRKNSNIDFDADWDSLNWSDITDVTPSLTEINFVNGVTSSIQTQLNGKQATITGGASTITSSNLTINRALISNASGKVAVSTVTSTELGFVSGVTSSIQTQLNGKQATITGGATSITSANLTINRALVSDGTGKVAVSAVTSAELGFVSGVTSSIQTQLNSKLTYSGSAPSAGQILIYNGGWTNLPAGTNGQVLKMTSGLPAWGTDLTGGGSSLPNGGTAGQFLKKNSAVDGDAIWASMVWADLTNVTPTLAEINFVSGVTSSIQTQLNGKQATITGAATTITSSNLTIDRALISNGSGKVAVSTVTATELGHLSGVTSSVQTQLNGKQATITGAASTVTSSNLTTNRMVYSNGSGKLGAANVGYTDANDYMTYTIQYDTTTTVNSRIPTEKWVTDNFKVTEGAGAPVAGSASTFGIHLYIDTTS